MDKPSFTANPGSLEATTTYIFNKPRGKVFAAFIDPQLIPKWWLEDEEITVEKMDVKEGGAWRFSEKTDNGTFVFRGVYHRVDEPNQLITTWAFEGTKAVALETVTFEDAPDGGAKVTDQFVFQSLDDREMMLTTGMENGTIPMMERLEQLI